MQPLALVFYEKLMPGSQLVNRLQDLNYRVQAIADPNQLPAAAETQGPMLVFVDLQSNRDDVDVPALIGRLRGNPATAHVPVVGFSTEAGALQAQAQAAGATLVVCEAVLLSSLPQVLEQALQVD
jgi:PleD family two-component response regulator